MVTRPTNSKRTFHFEWRALAAYALIAVGIVTLVGFQVVHWTERQILTTDNWVKMVGPLPQNNTVATALSTYAVNTLFTTTNLEQRISQALPDKASFLAPTLTAQLQDRLTKRAKNIIQSDQFQSVWQSANRAASQRLLENARNDTSSTATTPAKFNLNLASLKTTVGSLLSQHTASTATNTSASGSGKNVGLGVNLKLSLARLKTYIRAVDFLNGVLGLLALVCLVGGLVISHARRRVLLIMSATIVVVALLQLIGVKALRPAIINYVQGASYRPAAGVGYDTLLASFRHSATVVAFIGAILFLIAFFTRSTILRRSGTIARQLNGLQKSTAWLYWGELRLNVRRYRWQAAGVVVLIGLTLMAFVLSLDWQGIIRSLLFILLIIELINLVAARPSRAPMKQ